MSGRLEGKIAMITGAASGIGLGTVERFIAEGAKVVAADVQTEKGRLLEQRFQGELVYVDCDVRQEEAVARAVLQAQKAFGGLDILFNNAGAGGVMTGIADMDADGWDATFALLVRSVMLGMKHAVPLMLARGGGSIVNTASIAALQAGWAPIAYSAAKAAVLHLSKVAAAELSPQRIRVNAICPGLIATSIFGASLGLGRQAADQMAARIEDAAKGFQPVPKPGLPADIAEAALFFASDASAFVSGAHLVVDGALTIGHPHSWRTDLPSPLAAALRLAMEPASP